MVWRRMSSFLGQNRVSQRAEGDDSAEAELPGRPPRRRQVIGELLGRTREERGEELAQVAGNLRIRPAYLAAIEAGRYDSLPGAVYAQGFVRAYANHLGLDGEEAVRRFKLEAGSFEPQGDLNFPVPLAERSIPGGPMLLVALVLAVCGYGLWYYLSTDDHPRAERVAEVPVDLASPPSPSPAFPPAVTAAPVSPAAPVPSPEAPTSSAATVSAAAPPVAASSGAAFPEAASPDMAAPAAPPLSAPPDLPATSAPLPSPTAPAASSAPAAPQVYGLANGPVRIVIHALSDSWVEVRGADRTLVLTRLLHAGDSYRVPDEAGLTMRTGNGAGLQIMVDGRLAPTLGGKVRRGIMLDPDRLLAGTAVLQ